jgi:hypothetical protein
MRCTNVLPLAALIFLGCQAARPTDSATETAAAPSSTPAPVASAAAKPASGERSLPPVDLTCASDADCVTFDDVLTGTTACCPGCTVQVASKRSFDAFRAACLKTPAPMCPPLGCAMVPLEAKCVGGTCRGTPAH